MEEEALITAASLMETLKAIDITQVDQQIERLKDQVSSIKQEIAQLRSLRRFLGTQATANATAKPGKPTRNPRVPRGLFERMCGVFQASLGDTFSARDLANQLSVTPADIHLCIERNKNQFFTEGDRYGMRRAGN